MRMAKVLTAIKTTLFIEGVGATEVVLHEDGDTMEETRERVEKNIQETIDNKDKLVLHGFTQDKRKKVVNIKSRHVIGFSVEVI